MTSSEEGGWLLVRPSTDPGPWLRCYFCGDKFRGRLCDDCGAPYVVEVWDEGGGV